MQRYLRSACLSSLIYVAVGCSAGQDAHSTHDAPATQVEAPSAPPTADGAITQATVYENERYWPAIVAMTKDWMPPSGAKPLKAQYRGALVRVEADGRVRIDFGRHGRHDIPIDHTDLVVRADEVRAGIETKLAPNFVLRVGNSLVDPSGAQVRPLKFDDLARARSYLCVFADPRAEEFPSLAQQLASLESVNGVRAVFFPQSVGRDDLEFVHERLGTLTWHVPYMYPQLSENYTLSLLGDLPERPHAQLVSPEGRVLYEAELGTAAEFAELRHAVDRV